MANEFKVKNGLIVIGDLTTSGTITINGALAATQSWVTSQSYLTSASLSGYATQSYVTSAIASLVDSAPAALDTLKELATALGNDASFATTVTNSIAGKMALYNGVGAPDFNTNTTNGIYRNQGGANAPVSAAHFTMFSAFQPDGNYGWQLAASASDSLYFRFKDANFNSWVQLATRSWVTSQNYLTSYTDTLATVTSRGASTSTPVTFNGNVTLGNNADLVFQDLSGTFPTTGKGFDWTLNNDGARIYAYQPNSDSIDFVFQLRDNATLNDRFVFWVDEWQGPAYDKYPLIISGGTQFDLKDSALYTNSVLRLSNSGVLQNVTGNISMFTNNVGYLTSYTETDTLSSVVARGATTSNSITVGGITVSASNIAGITLYDTLQSYGWTIRTNGTNLYFVDSGGNNLAVLTSGGVFTLGSGYAKTINFYPNHGTTKSRISGGYGNGYLDFGGIGYGNITKLSDNEIQVGSDAYPQLFSMGPGGTSLNIGSYTYSLKSGSTTYLFASTSGLIGIGLTTPQKKLDVYGTGIVASFGGTFSPGDFAGIHFGYSESNLNNDSYKKSALVFERTDNHNQGGNASGKIHFLLNNAGGSSATALTASVVTIDSDANGTVGSVRMGIGTRNPIYPLQVVGSAYVNGGTLFLDSSQYLRWGNSNQGIVGVNDSHVAIVSGGATRQTVYADGRTYFPGLDLSISNVNSSHGTGTYFRGDGSHFVLGLNNGNTFYLNYGNGTGTLRTYGTWYHHDVQILSTSRVLTNVSGNISMFTNDAGYLTSVSDVWVNTTGDTMTGSLTFANNADDVRINKNNNWLNLYDPWNNIHLRNGNAGYGVYIDSTVHYWRPHDGSAYWMTLSSTGLGIGVNSPNYKLDVGGTIALRNTSYYSGTYDWSFSQNSSNGRLAIAYYGSEKVSVLDNGNVGVGTTSPSEKLHVSGAAIFDGGAGNSSTDSVVYITKSNNNDWGLYVNASGLDYGMYARVSPSAGYAIGVNNGTDWTTRITGNAIIYLGEKNAIEGNYDTWLRLNNSNHYASGVYTPGVMRADGGFQVGSNTVIHSGTIGSQSVNYATSAGSASTAATATDGLRLLREDNRTISPSELAAGYLKFGFTSWTNDNGGPYADFLHLRSYTDYTGGDDNLVMFKKSGIGMRIWQQSFGSSSAYSSYADVWTTVNFTQSNVNNWNTAYGWGNHASAGYLTSVTAHTQAWSTITSTPTTISGYGITNAYTDAQIQNFFSGANSISGYNKSNWDTAYSWGNHASQSYATTSYVTTQINNLVNGAPGALDTLSELASALGNDSSFATTVTNSIAGKVSKSGDTITGNLNVVGNIYSTTSLGIILNAADSPLITRGWDQFSSGPYSGIGRWGVFMEPSTLVLGTPNIAGNGQVAFRRFNPDGTSTTTLLINSVGDTTIYTNLTVGGTITENSSIKLKENVQTSEGNLEKVVNLRPVTYNKIGSQTTELGLIAEEVAEVYPEFVQYDENGEPVGVHYSRLTAALIGAVKELTNQVQELNKKING